MGAADPEKPILIYLEKKSLIYFSSHDPLLKSQTNSLIHVGL